MLRTFRKRKISIMLVLLLPLLGLVLLSFRDNDRYFEISRNLEIFAALYQEVNTFYVDDTNPNLLMKTGVDAMLGSLDPYTNYIPEDLIEDFRTQTTGEYGGIGALVGYYKGKHIVLMPTEGYSAHEKGIKIGDEIIEIGGTDITKLSHEEAGKILKGQADTQVKIKVRRYGQSEPLLFTLERKNVIVKNVPYYGMVKDDVGYIKLAEFTTEAGLEVHDALIELKDKGATKVILDLRGNLGGLLFEAVNTTNVFIPKGSLVVSTRGKFEEMNNTYRTLNPAVDTEIPVVVLTDNMSASASEIVAGSLQDYDRAVVVGQKSFGKGLVQATRDIPYNSQLKLTTAKYYTPSGRCIQALDYSNRRADGSVGKVPDSLKSSFTTMNGRLVYDGGGVDPDVLVESTVDEPVILALTNQMQIFDYATRYYYEHDSISSPRDFQLSATEYAQFKEWLSSKGFSYETGVEKRITSLMEDAEELEVAHYSKEAVEALKNKLASQKVAELERNQSRISHLLEEEIVARYFLEEGQIQAAFTHDPDVLKAIEILNDKAQYDAILKGVE